MFTVKYVNYKGVEFVTEAETVEFVPYASTKDVEDSYGALPGVTLNFSNGEAMTYGFSQNAAGGEKVYVMNEHGKTVATYTL